MRCNVEEEEVSISIALRITARGISVHLSVTHTRPARPKSTPSASSCAYSYTRRAPARYQCVCTDVALQTEEGERENDSYTAGQSRSRYRVSACGRFVLCPTTNTPHYHTGSRGPCTHARVRLVIHQTAHSVCTAAAVLQRNR